MPSVRLHALAHSRTGDKGDSQTLSVIAYDPEDFPLLRAAVTEAAVARHFAAVVHGPVTRHELPRLFALHFVLERALAGGVAANSGLRQGLQELAAQEGWEVFIPDF